MDRILEDISQWSIEKRRAKLEEIYEQRIGTPLNLDNPQRFTEKTQWRKLYEDDPRITRCIDKLTFKQYIREKLGEGYTSVLIDVWHSPNDVNIKSVPERCVIKSNCSGDGNYTMIIRDKSNIDVKAKEFEIKNEWFDRRNLHTNSFFKAYYPINPCVIVEELVTDKESGVDEYKIFCFDGIPQYVYHSDNHFECGAAVHEYPISFFDLNWNNLGVRYGKHPNNKDAKPPKFISEMLDISRILSKNFSFVRVDFFETDNRVYLAELTFTQGAGLTPYYPDDFDFCLGGLWKLNMTSK